MDRIVQGAHMGFMRHIMGNRARRKAHGTWVTPRTEVVREAAGTQSSMTYIIRIKGLVAQWVMLWLIFEVCVR